MERVQMRFEGHERVSRFGEHGWTVRVDGRDLRVLPNGAMGWGVYTGPNLEVAMVGGSPAVGYADVEELVGALLGVSS